MRKESIRLINKLFLVSYVLTFLILIVLRVSYNISFIECLTPVAAFLFFLIMSAAFKKFEMDEKNLIFVNLFIWCNLFGIYYAFDNLFYYDKFVHFATSSFITLLFCDYYSKSNLKQKNIFVFLSVLGILTLWEFYEYLVDVFFNLKDQGVYNAAGQVLVSPLDDTMQDLMVGSVSSLFTLTLITVIKSHFNSSKNK